MGRAPGGPSKAATPDSSLMESRVWAPGVVGLAQGGTCQQAGEPGVNPGLVVATKVSDTGCLPALALED